MLSYELKEKIRQCKTPEEMSTIIWENWPESADYETQRAYGEFVAAECLLYHGMHFTMQVTRLYLERVIKTTSN